MKIALAQLDYHIGNFLDNTTSIVMEIKKAQQSECDLIVFSELSICGYPPLDLLERKDFIRDCIDEIHRIAKICKKIGVLIGGPSFNEDEEGKILFNSAYFLNEGKVKQVFHKSLLPTYDIFDEYRYFEPNRTFSVLNFRDKKIAVTICEDLWDDQPVETEFERRRLYKLSPMEELSKHKPDLLINLAASPYSHSRIGLKRDIFTAKAKKYNLPVLYVNQVGAQTQLIFEGGSLAVNKEGSIATQLSFFEEDVKVVDFNELQNNSVVIEPPQPERIQMIHDALITGIKGYFDKSGLSKAVIGLSGGIDSAVTLVLAAIALGPENVHALLMPSDYSSRHSIDDSIKLVETIGVKYDKVNIQESFNSIKKSLKPIFENQEEDITEENIQSRIRGILVMAYSNKFGHIMLNTSNKSEASVGYGTLYGDMAGGLSVLGDVYKTDVYALAKYINMPAEIIPSNILTKAPSAELKPGQKDIDSLPEYDILDKILFEYIERQRPAEEIKNLDPDLVSEIIRKVNINEYKRYQTPPILRVSSKAFGYGRRIPLVAKY